MFGGGVPISQARADVACKGALPVAEKATAAVGQPLALAGRNAGREGLAATRTIGPYEGRAPLLPPQRLLGDADV